MSYSQDVNLFWDLMELSESTLVVDNDMCYISYPDRNQENFVDLDPEEIETESQSFDFTPRDLVDILADRLEIEVESV